MAGGIIIRLQAAVEALLAGESVTAKDRAMLVRALAHQYTSQVHNVIVRKWIELKALCGFHG